MSAGSVEQELELGVPAIEAWDLFGTLRFREFAEQEMPKVFQKVELVEGDGGVGTVVKITLAPGTLGLSPYKDRFTKVDNEKRIKELEVIEGGHLELGFTMFRVRFEVLERGEASSIIKSTIEYQLQEDDVAANNNGHLVSDFIEALAYIAQVAKLHLNKT
ncbi:hypothetical protein QN277_009021 [Acacia crassicarpa]|uniref:Bet v I/Major latex protein domain-containing protein n=1 Tax=Acacia crassicarpa TaxID=499986 RepID=A0AAE1IUE7_9FABA|nr:hypothetical protein QN277_009021 [Acacia crassicarpa]